MNGPIPLAQLDRAIRDLTYDEQLWLVERLIHALRKGPSNRHNNWDAALVEMAADPQVQMELAAINLEFGPAEMDGLEEP